MHIIKTFFVLMIFFILSSNLYAQDDNQKILILTDYLIKNEGQTVEQARNQAIATIYGEPVLKQLIYDEQSETFFAKLTSQKGDFSKDVNFYMPYTRALEFKKDLEASLIEITHSFENNKIYIKDIELNYDNTYYPLNISQTNTFTLKIGSYIVDSQETDITVKKHGLGATVNFQDLLGMPKNANIFRADARYKFNSKHSLELSYYSIDNHSFNTIDRELSWGDTNINAGAKVSSYFDTDIYKLNYNYSFYQTNKINLLLRVGLHITSMDTGFSANADVNGTDEYTEVSNINITAPLPIFGLGLSYKLTPKLKFNYVADYFFLTIQDLKGNMLDSMLSLDYQFNRYVGVGAGYNVTKMNFITDTDDINFKINHKISGALVYLILSY